MNNEERNYRTPSQEREEQQDESRINATTGENPISRDRDFNEEGHYNEAEEFITPDPNKTDFEELDEQGNPPRNNEEEWDNEDSDDFLNDGTDDFAENTDDSDDINRSNP